MQRQRIADKSGVKKAFFFILFSCHFYAVSVTNVRYGAFQTLSAREDRKETELTLRFGIVLLSGTESRSRVGGGRRV
jgi:hypothetical protein